MIMMMTMSSYISADFLSFRGNSQKERSVAMVTSPWQPRMSKSLLHCFKFRYLVYGPEAHHLEIFHKYRGEDRESRIWTASQDDTDIWRHGQVPVRALGEFQVNRSKLDREQSFSNGHWQIPKTQHDVKSKRGTPRYDAGYTGYWDDLAEWCLRREKLFLCRECEAMIELLWLCGVNVSLSPENFRWL